MKLRPAVLTMMALALGSAGAQGNGKPDSAAKPAAARVIVPAYRNRVVGVFDGQTFQPVEGVEVSDMMGGNKSLTSSTGNVSLFFLPEGASLVRLRKLGYESQTFLVTIAPQDSSPITIVMARVTELQTIVTTDSTPRYRSPGLQGFQERMKAGAGYFVDGAELRKREDQKLADVITAKVPGINMLRVGGNSTYLTSQRITGTGGTCYPDVYLDGTLLAKQPDPRQRRITGVDLSQFDVASLGAIEFYQGGATLPPEYNGTGSGCGALLLWTREK
jgi:hypothetical protein